MDVGVAEFYLSSGHNIVMVTVSGSDSSDMLSLILGKQKFKYYICAIHLESDLKICDTCI